jgi:hypothetical protein
MPSELHASNPMLQWCWPTGSGRPARPQPARRQLEDPLRTSSFSRVNCRRRGRRRPGARRAARAAGNSHSTWRRSTSTPRSSSAASTSIDSGFCIAGGVRRVLAATLPKPRLVATWDRTAPRLRVTVPPLVETLRLPPSSMASSCWWATRFAFPHTSGTLAAAERVDALAGGVAQAAGSGAGELLGLGAAPAG